MSDHVELNENIKSVLKDVFKFVYGYYDLGNGYCGGFSYDDRVEEEGGLLYYVSTEYVSFNEMINHLKEYMTEHVIYGKYYMSSDAYIEKDGKLYCSDFGKGVELISIDGCYDKI